jgi:hypothetical protein
MAVKFDRKEWKKKLSKVIREHPELVKMTGKIGLHLNDGNACKVKIEDKEL